MRGHGKPCEPLAVCPALTAIGRSGGNVLQSTIRNRRRYAPEATDAYGNETDFWYDFGMQRNALEVFRLSVREAKAKRRRRAREVKAVRRQEISPAGKFFLVSMLPTAYGNHPEYTAALPSERSQSLVGRWIRDGENGTSNPSTCDIPPRYSYSRMFSELENGKHGFRQLPFSEKNWLSSNFFAAARKSAVRAKSREVVILP